MEGIEIYQPSMNFSDDDLKNAEEISNIFWQSAENVFHQKQMTMKCPLCDRTHEIEKRTRIVSATIKGKHVTYEETVYYCENAKVEFETGSLVDRNLSNARKALTNLKGDET